MNWLSRWLWNGGLSGTLAATQKVRALAVGQDETGAFFFSPSFFLRQRGEPRKASDAKAVATLFLFSISSSLREACCSLALRGSGWSPGHASTCVLVEIRFSRRNCPMLVGSTLPSAYFGREPKSCTGQIAATESSPRRNKLAARKEILRKAELAGAEEEQQAWVGHIG